MSDRKTLRIAVCDDSASDRTELIRCIEKVFPELGAAFDVVEFGGCDDLLAAGADCFDIAFLDVEMADGGSSGMQAARQIRAQGLQLPIVFVSNYIHYAPDGYAVNAYRYLLKPVSASMLRLEIGKLIPRMMADRDRSSLMLRSQGRLEAIPRSEVSHIETAAGKNVVIHTFRDGVCGSITNHGPLGEWQSSCGDGFFRCHASYLVNLSYVMAIEKDQALLSTGERIPVSRHRRKELLRAFESYVGSQL